MEIGRPFSATAAGTNSGATATASAETIGETNSQVNVQFFVKDISGGLDKDGKITIESPAGTVLWESQHDVSVEGFKFSFPGLDIECPPGEAAVGKLDGSTADCQVTISGRKIP